MVFCVDCMLIEFFYIIDDIYFILIKNKLILCFDKFLKDEFLTV